jgi:hypothetical protein
VYSFRANSLHRVVSIRPFSRDEGWFREPAPVSEEQEEIGGGQPPILFCGGG